MNDRAAALVIGDVTLDRRIEGGMHRISPEAPCPVVNVTKVTDAPGCAGNVAMNLAALGIPVYFIGVAGADAEAQRLIQLFGEAGIFCSIPTVAERRTNTKTRITCDGQQILRVDEEGPLSDGHVLMAIRHLFDTQQSHDIRLIVVVDYNKGAMTSDVIQYLRDQATVRRLPVFVDAKPAKIRAYAGVGLLKPNLKEAMQLVTEDAVVHPALAIPDPNTQAEVCIQHLRAHYNFGTVVITCGPHGAVFFDPVDGRIGTLTGTSRTVFDVTGAGDTFMAALAAGSLEGRHIHEAVMRANTAAGLAVRQHGLTVVTKDQLEDEVYREKGWAGKLMTLADAVTLVRRVQRANRAVVLANGCFDCIHAGHLEMLRFAKQQGDFLIVAYNDDTSLRALKGTNRPIVPDSFRASHLAIQAPVDAVVRFNGDAELLVRQLRPDVLVKASDALPPIPGSDYVASYGGRLAIYPITIQAHSSGLRA